MDRDPPGGGRTADDRGPARSAYLITAPTDAVRQYDLIVRVPHLRVTARYTTQPWVRIVANTDTGDVLLAAGIKVMRQGEEEDGA